VVVLPRDKGEPYLAVDLRQNENRENMLIWILAKKDLRLLLRDRRAVVILLAMPFIFILVLGLALGEGFGQKPDDRLRVTLVDLDHGDPETMTQEAVAWCANALGEGWGGVSLVVAAHRDPWAQVVQHDLTDTAGIRVEIIRTREEAEQLIRDSQRSAIIVFGPRFSERVTRCSFLVDGINPFGRDGINLETAANGVNKESKELDFALFLDPTQKGAGSIIEQVAQVSLMRVILPWMIGRAFEKLAEPTFMSMLANEVPGGRLLPQEIKTSLGKGVQGALNKLFPRYNLTGKTWAALTKTSAKVGGGPRESAKKDVRYQVLVPSYTVMFAFFLVLTVGWLFVTERRQGTMKRLRAAPLTRGEILLGKLFPCFILSVVQGLFLLGAGYVVFGMSWGPDPLWLVAVVFTTSMAATGLALLVASVAQTETQVAIYGTLLVMVLAGVSGCLMPRDLMPEQMKELSRITPHAWALDAYTQLLLSPEPNLVTVGWSCAALAGFGALFLGLAWWFLQME
jgi:ABC-type transport system involved in multi-copper enzyme maturation permease subunit